MMRRTQPRVPYVLPPAPGSGLTLSVQEAVSIMMSNIGKTGFAWSPQKGHEGAAAKSKL
jgi:hypothetical protein